MAGINNKCKCFDLDKLGGVLLFICALCLVGALVLLFIKVPSKPTVTEISLAISTDSTGVVDAASEKAIDSLLTLVNEQNEFVRNRYSYMIEQKEYENGLLTFGGIIVSIILGILGFFGYKSFKSIEEKAISNAEEKVKQKVNGEMVTMQTELANNLTGTIEKRFQEEYDNRLGEEVGKKLNENYNESISAKLNYIEEKKKSFDDLQKRTNQVEQFISQLRDKGITLKFPQSDEDKRDVDEFAEERKKSKADNTNDGQEGGVV